jgi:hypothetical protein
MVQIYEEFVVKKAEKIEEAENQVDEVLGDLNPNYFEEAIHLKEAKERIKASNIYAGSKFDIFSIF